MMMVGSNAAANANPNASTVSHPHPHPHSTTPSASSPSTRASSPVSTTLWRWMRGISRVSSVNINITNHSVSSRSRSSSSASKSSSSSSSSSSPPPSPSSSTHKNDGQLHDRGRRDANVDFDVDVDVEVAMRERSPSSASASPLPSPVLTSPTSPFGERHGAMISPSAKGVWDRVHVGLAGVPASMRLPLIGRRVPLPHPLRMLMAMIKGGMGCKRKSRRTVVWVMTLLALILTALLIGVFVHFHSSPSGPGSSYTALWNKLRGIPPINPIDLDAEYIRHPKKLMTAELAKPTQKQCSIRYSFLGGVLPLPTTVERYFIAINLHNSAENGVVQAMTSELIRLAYLLAERTTQTQTQTSDATAAATMKESNTNDHKKQNQKLKKLVVDDDGDGVSTSQSGIGKQNGLKSVNINNVDDNASDVRVNPRNVYISIYESASTDETPVHLHALDRELSEYGIPHRIITNGHIVQDREGEHRIQSLTQLRYESLQPMYEAALKYDDTDGKEGWRSDRVMIINDVFWCAEDALRLLEEGDGGTEADKEADREEERMRQEAAMQHLSQQEQQGKYQSFFSFSSALATKPTRTLSATTSSSSSSSSSSSPSVSHPNRPRYPDIVCAMDYSGRLHRPGLSYYDQWVFRDRGGERLIQHFYPFYADSYDRAAYREARRMDVTTCWGGMAVIRGSLFWHHRLSLRARTESCSWSECAHIATDIIALKGKDAWIQQDTMTAVTYLQHFRDQLLETEWYNVDKRLEHRRLMRDKRRKRDVAACIAEDAVQRHCPNCRVATSLFPPDPTPLSTPPRYTLSNQPPFSANYTSNCPSQPYPLPTYVSNSLPYPPPSYCCGEFGQPHYALNCHHVVTAKWNEDQVKRMWQARFNPFVMLHVHEEWDVEWM